MKKSSKNFTSFSGISIVISIDGKLVHYFVILLVRIVGSP